MMIVSIHQPQYIPWAPYFLKVAASDVFILLDSVDFQKNGLQNRNQIKTAQGSQWLTVPVKQRLGQKIIDVEVDNNRQWRKSHWATVQQNYGKSMAFKHYEAELEYFFVQEWSSLNELNSHMIALILKWLNIECKILRSSEMQAEGCGSDLILNLCAEAGAEQYISGVGGHEYLDKQSFCDAGIHLEFMPPVLPSNYPQRFAKAGFINDLSVLDMILNCGDDWRKYFSDIKVLSE